MNKYPTEEELTKISRWPYTDWPGMMDFIKPLFEGYGCFRKIGESRYRLATGGWSGNEDAIEAMRENHLFWACCWRASARGGLFIFDLKEINIKKRKRK